MPIPTQSEAYRITLGIMTDGKQRTNKQIKDDAKIVLALSEDKLKETTSTGIPLWESRIDWSTQYLQRAFLLTRIRRGLYEVSDEGRKVYESGLDGIELGRQLDAWIKERNPWNLGSESEKKKKKDEKAQVTSDMSPEEQIDLLHKELNDSLSNELLDLILERDPAFFERLVVNLLERMGYGNGETTQYVGDGGIDGIITTDALGFDPIHVQAKRYAIESKVSRPEVQAFAGALKSVTRGAFITTSTFTNEAREYADTFPHATIILIDGKELTKLMIKHNLGVTTERSYEIKRIDGDYFEG